MPRALWVRAARVKMASATGHGLVIAGGTGAAGAMAADGVAAGVAGAGCGLASEDGIEWDASAGRWAGEAFGGRGVRRFGGSLEAGWSVAGGGLVAGWWWDGDGLVAGWRRCRDGVETVSRRSRDGLCFECWGGCWVSSLGRSPVVLEGYWLAGGACSLAWFVLMRKSGPCRGPGCWRGVGPEPLLDRKRPGAGGNLDLCGRGRSHSVRQLFCWREGDGRVLPPWGEGGPGGRERSFNSAEISRRGDAMSGNGVRTGHFLHTRPTPGNGRSERAHVCLPTT